MTGYEHITLEKHGRVAVITLNRPKALNALNVGLGAEVVAASTELDADPGIGAILLTGSEKAFAAGADIKEMAALDYAAVVHQDFFAGWDRFAAVRTPTIAAVAGYALGGGCEVAMMCDFIIAAENAKFGQPEITLGTIPGIGGTQRLARAVGKAKAMDLVLTGRTMDAEEAERSGLVARIVPTENLVEEALAVAEKIASMSLPAAYAAKEAVAQAYESTLDAGVRFERRTFHATFALADRTEGMNAFVEKRAPQFRHA
ncbi:enoyl-CoA hydratase [Nocardioides sp. NPDC006273]|uniref:enoyl-CoA hydratase n=1 Tax=Nocardioides sp. NPDC006273 TaxID=3155598 RepID=UPI0033B7215B